MSPWPELHVPGAGCPLKDHLSEAPVQHRQVRPQQPLGLPLHGEALNPFPALAPELLVHFLQLLGEP